MDEMLRIDRLLEHDVEAGAPHFASAVALVEGGHGHRWNGVAVIALAGAEPADEGETVLAGQGEVAQDDVADSGWSSMTRAVRPERSGTSFIRGSFRRLGDGGTQCLAARAHRRRVSDQWEARSGDLVVVRAIVGR